MISGVIALLAVLTIAAQIFSQEKLANKNEALALPAGSVRAIIALSLIIIFAIIIIFIFDSFPPESTTLQIPANQTILYTNGTIL
jgi:TRAP-type C4-dicarboxylate transport system permease small subunit